jgi:hypothetical protein
MDGIVFQEVRQRLRIGKIIDRHKFQLFPIQTSSKGIPTNSSKSVYPDPHCHRHSLLSKIKNII